MSSSLLTVEEVADLLKISPGAMYKRGDQRSHSRKFRYTHHNPRKGETKCFVCGVLNREKSCNLS